MVIPSISRPRLQCSIRCLLRERYVLYGCHHGCLHLGRLDLVGPINLSANDITALACPTSTFCAAVDDAGNAYIWNGSTWSGPTNIDDSGIADLSCPTSTFCAAVDDAGNAITWDGSTWSGPTSIDPSSPGIVSISCPEAGFCMVVDYAGHSLTWDGSLWSAPVNCRLHR